LKESTVQGLWEVGELAVWKAEQAQWECLLWEGWVKKEEGCLHL
jgi:hypothetical protein